MGVVVGERRGGAFESLRFFCARYFVCGAVVFCGRQVGASLHGVSFRLETGVFAQGIGGAPGHVGQDWWFLVARQAPPQRDAREQQRRAGPRLTSSLRDCPEFHQHLL